jgi:hypothetical protein
MPFCPLLASKLEKSGKKKQTNSLWVTQNAMLSLNPLKKSAKKFTHRIIGLSFFLSFFQNSHFFEELFFKHPV